MLNVADTPQDTTSENQRLQEYFSIAIPKLLELIKEKNITHILLLEKTARLFKEPLIQLFRKLNLDIKVGSFAPDYFPVDPNYEVKFSGRINTSNPIKVAGKREYEKKLKYLPQPKEDGYEILVLDEFVQNGTSIEKITDGLTQLGYRRNNIHQCSFDGCEIVGSSIKVLHGDNTVDELICNFSRFPYSKSGRRDVFESDSYKFSSYHATLNNKHPNRFREVVKNLIGIILNSVD